MATVESDLGRAPVEVAPKGMTDLVIRTVQEGREALRRLRGSDVVLHDRAQAEEFDADLNDLNSELSDDEADETPDVAELTTFQRLKIQKLCLMTSNVRCFPEKQPEARAPFSWASVILSGRLDLIHEHVIGAQSRREGA